MALNSLLPLAQFNIASVAESVPLIANGLSSLRLPLGPLPLMVTPSCLAISRRISATVTRKLTWSSPRMVSELMTLPLDPPEADIPAAPNENEPLD